MQAPKIDDRDFDLIRKEIGALAPFYVPEWKASHETDAGVALLKVFALMLEGVIKRLNQAPEKQFIAFLNMLGTELLPAQPARLPLTFFLSSGATEPVVVPAGTQAAADLPDGSGQLVFETEKTFLATPARLRAVYSCAPAGDLIIRHDPDLDAGREAALFSGTDLQEHCLYLGHGDLFNLKGEAEIRIQISPFSKKLADPALCAWEYWGEATCITNMGINEVKTKTTGWQPLEVAPSDTLVILKKRNRVSRGIITNSQVTGEIGEWELSGITSRWIRCRVLSGRIGAIQDVEIDKLQVSVSPVSGEKSQRGIAPDMAFFHDTQLDLAKPFYPFGRRPSLYATFYLASQEVFSKKGAAVVMEIDAPVLIVDRTGVTAPKSSAGDVPAPKASDDAVLAWEYWNGAGWMALRDLDDDPGTGGTNRLTQAGKISFTCPDDMAQATVAGQQNYWIRARLISGDYGRETYDKDGNPSSTYTPPYICAPRMRYEAAPASCEVCLTSNNHQYAVHSCHEKFHPFLPMDDQRRALYLGFDQPPLNGPVSVFLALEEQEYDGEKAPRLLWEYAGSGGAWERLDVLDGTAGLTRCGTIAFIGPADLAPQERFGENRYWIRAVDVDDRFENTASRVRGIYLNTTWALQAETVKDETLGSSDGTAGQSFKLTKTPVISERIWVNELGALTEPEMRGLVQDGKAQVNEVKDKAGSATAFWVCWQPVGDLVESAPTDRSYAIDRATGEIRFGDGVNGAAPPAGRDNIKADYQAGGGAAGNVGSLAVSTLKTSLAFIDHVSNPVGTGGGCDTERPAAAMERGPQVIRHRNYAVTAEDFERLARMASRSIARAKCLPNFSKQTGDQSGWVTVVVAPESSEARPGLSPQLRQQVLQYLSDRAANVVTAPRRLLVEGPDYVGISVRATLYTNRIDLAPDIEQQALARLSAFLHPLTGGHAGQGWEFGQLPCLSDFYVLLGGIYGVDRVADLDMEARAPSGTQPLAGMAPYALVCGGKHAIDVRLSVDSSANC